MHPILKRILLALANLFVIPGVGTLGARRWLAGSIQLTLSIIGITLTFASMVILGSALNDLLAEWKVSGGTLAELMEIEARHFGKNPKLWLRGVSIATLGALIFLPIWAWSATTTEVRKSKPRPLPPRDD
jgi:hypothetical protein